jgi:hypothetical protein
MDRQRFLLGAHQTVHRDRCEHHPVAFAYRLSLRLPSGIVKISEMMEQILVFPAGLNRHSAGMDFAR